MSNSATPVIPWSAKDIQHWSPSSLSEIVGCEEIKEALVDLHRNDGDGENILIDGETGSGKTILVKSYLRTRNCPNATNLYQGPCEVCDDCKGFDYRFNDNGIFAQAKEKVRRGGKATHYFSVNCYLLNAEVADHLRVEIELSRDDRNIVFLDEFDGLSKNLAQQALLTMIPNVNAIWIAAGISRSSLSPMLVRRFASRYQTSRPTVREFSHFLKERCERWGLEFEKPAIVQLAQRSGGVISEAISVLAKAAGTKDRCVTEKLVLSHPFLVGLRQDPAENPRAGVPHSEDFPNKNGVK